MKWNNRNPAPALDGLLTNIERAIPIMRKDGHKNPLQYRPVTKRRNYPHLHNAPKAVYEFHNPAQPPPPFRNELSQKMLTHIYDMMGLTEKNGLPLYRCVVFVCALHVNSNELNHYQGILRENGLMLTSIKSDFVSFIAKRAPVKYGELLNVYKYTDYFITCTDSSVDPVEVLKKANDLLKVPLPIPVLQVNSMPIRKRFMISGARLDYELFLLDKMNELLKISSKEQLVADLTVSLDHNIRELSKNVFHPLSELARNIDFMKKEE